MAMSRLCLKNLQRSVCTWAPPSGAFRGLLNATQQGQESDCRLFSTAPEATEKPDEIAVSQGPQKSKLASRRGRGLWRNRRWLMPFGLGDLMPRSGFGDAVVHMTENLNRMFESLSAWQLFGRIKEDDKAYKLKLEVPGLTKDDLKITLEDGFLVIKGQHKEEDEESSADDERLGYRSFGYYNARILLPSDAKPEEIRAELKHGVLSLTIPKSEEAQAKGVKEVKIE